MALITEYRNEFYGVILTEGYKKTLVDEKVFNELVDAGKLLDKTKKEYNDAVLDIVSFKLY
jgi:hypothetical protein